MRLDQYISNCAYATRKQAKKLAYNGCVKVNGITVRNAYQEVTDQDVITVNGQTVVPSVHRYYMMNKPSGVITATSSQIKKTIFDYLEFDTGGLFPVGRLDKDTEGLVIITDDGKMNHILLDPMHHVKKTYYAELKIDFDPVFLPILEQGIKLRSYEQTCAPAEVVLLSPRRMLITISEGKYHQVKKMISACHNKVVYLKRISMGNLTLDESLKPGEYRILDEDEIKLLMEN